MDRLYEQVIYSLPFIYTQELLGTFKKNVYRKQKTITTTKGCEIFGLVNYEYHKIHGILHRDSRLECEECSDSVLCDHEDQPAEIWRTKGVNIYGDEDSDDENEPVDCWPLIREIYWINGLKDRKHISMYDIDGPADVEYVNGSLKYETWYK